MQTRTPGPPAQAPALVFDGVALELPGAGTVLDGLDFAIAPGASLVLAGPAGCGKSAAAALAAGALRASAGSVRTLGEDPAALDPDALDRLRARLGVSPQRGALLSNLTLADNVALPLRWHRGLDAAAAHAEVEALYALMGASPPPPVQAAAATDEDRALARLARALALRPALLVLDEPGFGLDAALQEDIWRLLWRLQDELGFAVLATTSDAQRARAFTERVVPLPPRRRTTLRIVRPASP